MGRTVLFSNHEDHENGEVIITDSEKLIHALGILKENAEIIEIWGAGRKPLAGNSRRLYDKRPFHEIPGLDLNFEGHEIRYRNTSFGVSWKLEGGYDYLEIRVGYEQRGKLRSLASRLGLPYQADPLNKKKRGRRKKR